MQRLVQNAQQVFTVNVTHKDGFTPVSPRSHVIHRTWKLDSQGSCHVQAFGNSLINLMVRESFYGLMAKGKT